jgi:hypothetical protein
MHAQLDLLAAPPPSKLCPWCKTGKPLTAFGRSRHNADGRQPVCKACYALNERKNHNIRDAPPVPRRSAYDVIADELDVLEAVAIAGGDMLRAIDDTRAALKL